jgi:formylglycine-generating enzyme required for sulfatase activity
VPSNNVEDNADKPYQTWGSNLEKTAPINCVSWFTAFAFCIWDGGRLPTESEWEYAAAGGEGDRLYPWGPEPPNGARAVYRCLGDGSAAQVCAIDDILPVGSKTSGAGRYGQLDLAGSMWEWVLDHFADYPSEARDFAKLSSDPKAERVYRGGCFLCDIEGLKAADRSMFVSNSSKLTVFSDPPQTQIAGTGFRCARNP